MGPAPAKKRGLEQRDHRWLSALQLREEEVEPLLRVPGAPFLGGLLGFSF